MAGIAFLSIIPTAGPFFYYPFFPVSLARHAFTMLLTWFCIFVTVHVCNHTIAAYLTFIDVQIHR
jgi:hypothetical protein